MKNKLAIFSAAAIAVGRIFITPRLTHIPSPELTYEALAHLVCGGLIAIHMYDHKQKLYGYLGWGLALYELVYFLIQKML